MPQPVYTDDAIYGLPAKWYGPGGSWPGVSYPALALVVATTLTVTAITMAVATSVMTITKLLVGLALGLAIGVFLAKKIFPHVDEWMPLVGHAQALLDEITTPRRPEVREGSTINLGEVTRDVPSQAHLEDDPHVGEPAASR